MPEAVAPPPLPKSQPPFGRRYSTILKLLGVGGLVLVLLVPLAMITGVLSERLQRRNQAVGDITSSWGREQNVIGPVLGIPYQYRFKTVKEMPAPDGRLERREVEETATATAYFLPEVLNVAGDVQTQTLHRGIYNAVVFRAQVKLSGRFGVPDFGALKIDIREKGSYSIGAERTGRCSPVRRCRVIPPAQPRRSAATNRSMRRWIFPSRSILTGATGFSSRRSVCKIR